MPLLGRRFTLVFAGVGSSRFGREEGPLVELLLDVAGEDGQAVNTSGQSVPSPVWPGLDLSSDVWPSSRPTLTILVEAGSDKHRTWATMRSKALPASREDWRLPS